MTDRWHDELDTAGSEHLDPSLVDGYDAKPQVDPTEDIEILTSHGLGAGWTVVDLGAGPGSSQSQRPEPGHRLSSSMSHRP